MSRPARLPRWAGNRLSVSAGLRGKVAFNSAGLVAGRITPACAGKRRHHSLLEKTDQDHPRVCGEKYSTSGIHALSEGSPPRVRGKVGRVLAHSVILRITPACAGKRLRRHSWPQESEDHPRVCGEKGAKDITDCSGLGSPPRVRGKDVKPGVSRPIYRITPACAGKSLHQYPSASIL